MDNAPQKEHPNVTVAKINARQAIMVAIITVLATAIGAGTHQLLTTPKQLWLVLDDIRFYSTTNQPLRIIVDVNGISYSYPQSQFFFTPTAVRSPARFPLPIETSKATVLVHVLQLKADATVEAFVSRPHNFPEIPMGLTINEEKFAVDLSGQAIGSPVASVSFHFE